MEIALDLRVDVTKIDKARIYEGQKGKYLSMTVWIDTENESQYGDHGTARQSTSKEEREAGVKLPIIGNAKIFFRKESQQQAPQQQFQPQQQAPQPNYNQPAPQPNYNHAPPVPPAPAFDVTDDEADSQIPF